MIDRAENGTLQSGSLQLCSPEPVGPLLLAPTSPLSALRWGGKPGRLNRWLRFRCSVSSRPGPRLAEGGEGPVDPGRAPTCLRGGVRLHERGAGALREAYPCGDARRRSVEHSQWGVHGGGMLPPTAEISTSHPSRLKTVFSERYFRRLRPKKRKNARMQTPSSPPSILSISGFRWEVESAPRPR